MITFKYIPLKEKDYQKGYDELNKMNTKSGPKYRPKSPRK